MHGNIHHRIVDYTSIITIVGAVAAINSGEGVGPVYLDDVTCTGSESYLVNCSNRGIGVHNCRHYEDAAVICEGQTTVHDLATS